MASTRHRGNVLHVLTLSNLTSPTSANMAVDLISANLGDGSAEALTFADFASGIKSFALECEFAYSGDTNSAYDILWKDAGKTGVTFVWSPHGVTTAVAGKTVYTGVLTLPARPGLETAASESDYTKFSVTMECDSVTRTTV